MVPIRLDTGDFGDAVARLHESLRKQGFQISPEEEKRKFFGPSTSEAVRAFQSKHKLPVTRVVDAATQALLEKAPSAPVTELPAPSSQEQAVTGPTAGAASAPKISLDPPSSGLGAAAPVAVSLQKVSPTLSGVIRLNFTPDKVNSKAVGQLQTALVKLKFDIHPSDLARKELGQSTTEALRAFQESAGLPADGKLTPETLTQLNVHLEHTFVVNSKTRTQRLQDMLSRAGHLVDPAEVKTRTFGPSTQAALQAFQATAGLPQNGMVSDTAISRLREDALQARLSSKNQVSQLHRSLLRALNISKLENVRIDATELQKREIGPTTQAAFKAIQTKYGLKPSGELDTATFNRIESIANSVPMQVRQLKPTKADELKTVKRTARLNMKSPHVGEVQNALAFMGYKIDEKEFNTRTYGSTTRAAVVEYQRARSLPITGHVEGETLTRLNMEIRQANPQAATTEFAYRVRGAVRDDHWRGLGGLRIQVFERLIQGQGGLLAERQTSANGFFDIPYNPPVDPANKQIKRPYHLSVQVVDANNKPVVPNPKILFNPTQIAWVNFTQGDQPYRGVSVFETFSTAVQKAIGSGSIAAIEETPTHRQISQAAQTAALTVDEVMHLALAYRVAIHLKTSPLDAAACYAYIAQNLPSALHGDLLESTQDWTMIDQLVELAANGLVFMELGLQQLAFENAINENLMPIAVGRQKDAILAALAQLRQTYALEKPILAGNGSLQSLLKSSTVDQAHYGTVANAFLEHKTFGPDFWQDLNTHPADFGGKAAVQDLETTISVGHLTKNFIPMVDLLKNKINDPQVKNINHPADLAKLSRADWVTLIKENGGAVPPGTDDAGTEKGIQNYAATLASQSEALFPAVALAAAVGRSDQKPLPHIDAIQTLLSDHPNLNLRQDNLNTFVKDNKIVIDPDTLTEARVMQRVHRIAPTAATGQALLDQKIHNSTQIVAMGKDRFTEVMTQNPQVDKVAARAMFSLAQHQYAQVLQRIADYRFDLHRANPRAIVNYTYTPAELADAITAVPDLETLFGSLDFCDCPHCQSVYGPAAYLADVLRFLENHRAVQTGKTVKDVLFDRRQDIGNIKLNCQNTETPMPYIDLVCEVLENALAAPNPNPNFSFQSTRPPEELLAFPEHVRPDAYNMLRDADYPLDAAFDLWQEEARVFLQHLGVPRWELMEAFRAGPNGVPAVPTDASIAGEFWGMSSHETHIVTSTNENTDARQNVYWGFDSTSAEMTVSDFMTRARLDYNQLLDLLYVQWINPITDANRMVIERPNATCDTTAQKLTQLTIDRFDQMHRFLRLWRRTGWAMWELDLLIRSGGLGGSQINETTLVNLKRFKQLQQRLSLDTERALTLFGAVNTEVRVKTDTLDQEIDPLYTRLFLNPTVVKPVDEAFRLYHDGDAHLFVDYTQPLTTGTLSAVKPTLLAAFALTEPDLDLLLGKVKDDNLTVANLAAIGRRIYLANGLGLRIKDLLTLEDLTGATNNIFADPKTLLDFIELAGWVSSSGFAVDEIAYLLKQSKDSPYGPRDETLTGSIAALREALRASTAPTPDGVVISQVAGVFGLPPDQAQLLVNQVSLNGKSLLVILEDPRLTNRDSNDAYTLEINTANFQDMHDSYRLLYKISLLVTRFKIGRDDLAWLLSQAPTFKLLDLRALPVIAEPTSPLLSGWQALDKWLYFERLYPEPENMSLRKVFDTVRTSTSDTDVKNAIVGLTPWKAADLDDLTSGLRLHQVYTNPPNKPSDYADIDTYLRLWKCFQQTKRAGVTASSLLTWANRDDNTGSAQATNAQQIQQVVKSKYDYAAWLKMAAPLEDVLREKKRDALVSYLVETSLRTQNPEIQQGGRVYANPAYWRDANDLLNYYLIDVQMSACQLTSRIKQAISSTQMLVQRCLLGLEQLSVEVSRSEQQDTVSENSWKQWRWMKNYRLWEANRKIFLYPENWIEPELRDEKSPFFEELEAEIQQKDITDENVQAAFLHYVQKVHEVSHLDIVGAYYELDDTNPNDGLPPDINILHVIGRTHSHPSIYYYRRFDLNYGEWSAWEKIDLDIQIDQVTPVVYNRQLYLFWLTIVQKPQKVKKNPPAQPSNNTDAPEVPNQIEIQLSWSARKDNGWTARRLSKQKLIHPWQRPLFSYNLKPRYKSRENMLWLDIYITESQQFNNTRFWDAYRNLPDFVTAQRWNETTRPWHSSSFLFNGEVVDVKLKALAGYYHILNSAGIASVDLSPTTSYQYVHDSFGPDGQAIHQLSGPYEIAPRLPLPEGMHYENTYLTNNQSQLNPSRANILEHGATRTLLNGAISPFQIVFSQHHLAFDTVTYEQMPFFYQDQYRAFFIRSESQQITFGYNRTLVNYNYRFYPFYHPYSALFLRELNRLGLDGLLNRQIQTTPQSYFPGNSFNFSGYSPASMSLPDKTAQTDQVDFERYGAYSIYNWEIFFHAPLMIACKLSANQRFEEAMRWFHYIFDPTNTDSPDVPQRYWITRKFYEENSDDYRKQRIQNLLANIDEHKDELTAWKNNPFKPHLIARYRPVAYQKAVVMKYIDNLIAWGDQLFRQDTIEAINQATTLYVLAYEILGRRPVKVPNVQHEDKSYNELTSDGALDPFGNKRVDILMENFTEAPVRVTRVMDGTEPLPQLNVFYFGIPNNDQLLNYWSTVEDRLFKIRHCMNIAGVVRQLPLFEPPIDPALLVKAAAAGIDPASVLSDLAVAPGPYRFERLAQKALEICGEVRALGDKLLNALNSYDAEGLSLLRATQEIDMQNAVREVRKQQINDANETWASLEKSKHMAEQKRDYYQGRDFMNPWEITAIGLGGLSAAAQTAIAVGYSIAGGLNLIPRFTAGGSGFGGSPHVTVDPLDGHKVSRAAEQAVQTLSAIATAADKLGVLASTMGSYQRRQDEWNFQGQLAVTEIEQTDRQIAAAQIKLGIATKELENQELQIEQSQAVEEYLRSKYTNQQLFDWLARQAASVYFQSYQLAYDMAKRAEKSLQLEIGDPSATFIQFGYWDSLKKGLLAGERLSNDIRRMEAAYLNRHIRELEITKNVSLALVSPVSLLQLKESGACTVTLPEWMFDMDYPGLIRRRIKSVSISVPCVVGPYTSLNCTLSLTRHGIRLTDAVAAPDAASYGDALVGGDERFYNSPAPAVGIATSNGQNDSGMFELNFNDERFLPFEGYGAVSEWRIELPIDSNQFDLATISDVILHIRYTAMPGTNGNLRTAAKASLAAKLPTAGVSLLVLNHQFGPAWQRFLHPNEGAEQSLNFTLGPEYLPFYARAAANISAANISLAAVDLIVESTETGSFTVKLTTPGKPAVEIPMDPKAAFGGHQHLAKTDFTPNTALLGDWVIQIKKTPAGDYKSLQPSDLRNAYLVLGFKTA